MDASSLSYSEMKLRLQSCENISNHVNSFLTPFLDEDKNVQHALEFIHHVINELELLPLIEPEDPAPIAQSYNPPKTAVHTNRTNFRAILHKS